MKQVYLFRQDWMRTMRSRPSSMGVGVETKEEADRFLEEATMDADLEYEIVTVFASVEEALAYWKSPGYPGPIHRHVRKEKNNATD